MTVSSLDELSVGDDVWCLASLGVPYTVTGLDPEAGRLTISPHPAMAGTARPVTLTGDALWLVTTERWAQVWDWPDRAGERYEEVVDRFVASNPPGEVVQGYFLDTAIGATNQGFLTPNPKTAMAFEIQPPTPGFGQVRVRPVTAGAEGWVRVGPNVPLRVGMTWYRWSLSFGELVLNWPDFAPPDA
ncbi:MAG: hypothetical protein AB7H43_12490 [Acidimicrobiia bacterium]